MKLGGYVNLWIYWTLHIQTWKKMIINKLVKRMAKKVCSNSLPAMDN